MLADFFRAYTHEIAKEQFRRLLNIGLNNSKSGNLKTRERAVAFVKALLPHSADLSNEEHLLNEIVVSAKTGKTTGPEHRLSLYSMLGSIPPSPAVSTVIVENTPALFSKESNDGALSCLADNVVVHLVFVLSHDKPLAPDFIKAIIQDLTASRPTLRRATSLIIGTALQECDKTGKSSIALADLTEAAKAGFEANLASVTAATAGPIDGYIAIATLLGPVRRLAKSGRITNHM